MISYFPDERQVEEEPLSSSPTALARRALQTLTHDLDTHLRRIDDYYRGIHDSAYMPEMADDEYKLLDERSKTNYIPLLVKAPVQKCYVDGFRSGRAEVRNPKHGQAVELVQSAAWDFWQRSRLDARQTPVYMAAATYGHSFVLVEKDAGGRPLAKGLSPLRTAALYDDPANDEDAVAVVYVKRWPTKDRPGQLRLWHENYEYSGTFKAERDYESISLTEIGPTDTEACPVTRFAPEVDLDGRTTGVVEPIIPLQNRLNQTVFDLLVAQTGCSFETRTVTGMAPPLVQDPVRDELDNIIGFQPRLNDDGQPIPLRVQVNGKQMLYAEDKDVQFGSLPASPLDGYIAALKDISERLSAVTQTPPTYLMGQIANLSAEALVAAEKTLTTKAEGYRHAFGEAWERVFRLAAQIEGDRANAEDYHGEVIWQDMESGSLSETADGLGKAASMLGIPARGLWSRFPGATQGDLARWEEMREEDMENDPEYAMAEALRRTGVIHPGSTAGQQVAQAEE